MSTKDYPSIDFVRQCLREENGHLFWRERPRGHFSRDQDWKAWNNTRAGKEAGSPNETKKGKPRWSVGLKPRRLYRYQIVWAFHEGEWCELLDHKNRDQLDDQIGNLRPATEAQNHANADIRKKKNTSGRKGVSWDSARKKWRAQIKVDRKTIHLGLYSDINEAAAAYLAAAQKYYGEFHCAG